MASLSLLCRIYLGLVIFSLAGSLLSKLSGLNPGLIAPITSALTIAVGFCALFQSQRVAANKSTYVLIVASICLATTIESIGLTTGLPFGRYAYTDRWQPAIGISSHWFPLMLPFAWLMVVGSATAICSRLKFSILSAALLATMVDFLMEPVMTGPLRFWTWRDKGPLPGGAALLNPFGWFVTAYLVAWMIRKIRLDNRKTAVCVLAGHLALTFGIGAIALIPR